MPKQKNIKVELTNPQEKKNVVRYDADDKDAAVSTIYVRKDGLKSIGNPKSITVTIEAS